MHRPNKHSVVLTVLYLLIVAFIIRSIFWLLLKYVSSLAELISWGAATLFILFSLTGVYWNPFLLLARIPIRKPMLEEEQRILSCLEKLKACSRQLSNTRFRVVMTNTKELDAFAVGVRTISFSVGMLSTTTEEELCAVMAHEAGHIISRDTLLGAIFGSAYAVSVVVAGSIRLLRRILMFHPAVGITICVLYIIGDVLFFIFRPLPAIEITIALLLWYFGLRYVNLLFEKLHLYCSRLSEYRQDALAASLGFGKALRSVLLRFLQTGSDRVPTGLDLFLRYSHPILQHRIRALEKLEGLRD